MPQPTGRHYHPKIHIHLRILGYLRSLVVRAVHRHCTGVGSNLPEDLIVDEFFSTVPGKNFDLYKIFTRTKIH